MLSHVATRSLEGTGVSVVRPGKPHEPQDIIVHSPRVFREFLLRGTLGLGESYMRGEWDCDRLDQLFFRVAAHGKAHVGGGIPRLLGAVDRALSYLQSTTGWRARAREVIAHYDIGNDIYIPMLGSTMAYTCGYRGRGADTLEQMQLDKFRLVCEKLGLKPGQRLLDIGCGFGSFANFAATHFGVTVVGITLSDRQLAYAQEHAVAGTEFLKLDFRDLLTHFGAASFDHIASIGMFEAVEKPNFDQYMQQAFGVLRSGGLFVLHTITMDGGGFDPWLNKYIFPNGYLPDVHEVRVAASGACFELLDTHEFGVDYYHTLMAWARNFDRAFCTPAHLGEADMQFYRMFRYYLLQCAGLFLAEHTNLHQFVLGKDYAMRWTQNDDPDDDEEIPVTPSYRPVR